MTKTWAPAAPSSRAVSAPIPREPPVTRATRRASGPFTSVLPPLRLRYYDLGQRAEEGRRGRGDRRGFGRTGTLSLHSALETLGYGPCHHMREVLGDADATATATAARTRRSPGSSGTTKRSRPPRRSGTSWVDRWSSGSGAG
ncbi:sulfotransferase [Amycolatopsis magusensis]|uniref:sulfotransferase n=1 Tax=Amycolatopsis magusensis TaxID=882444 RepID=UPI0024A9C4FD|nr:sulfotransferase [Amycolatopsis magusensis]MDI5979179.1 sulfotransferase [Amycolatopsis magusensis]